MNLEAGWEMARLILTGENFMGYSPCCNRMEIINDLVRLKEPCVAGGGMESFALTNPNPQEKGGERVGE
jgi:hypothetical protein